MRAARVILAIREDCFDVNADIDHGLRLPPAIWSKILVEPDAGIGSLLLPPQYETAYSQRS